MRRYVEWSFLNARPALILALVFVFCASGLVACSSASRKDHEIFLRDPTYHEAVATGFAVAPVDMVTPLPEAAKALAFFTNEFYTSLLVFSQGTRYVEPGRVLAQVKEAGEAAQEEFQDFRRSRILGEELRSVDCSRMFGILRERFLTLVWVEEHSKMGMRDTASDYTGDIDFAQDVYKVTYQVYEGAITGEVIDLVRAQVVWKGASRYTTPELFVDQAPDDLWRRRGRGALALARLMSLN